MNRPTVPAPIGSDLDYFPWLRGSKVPVNTAAAIHSFLGSFKKELPLFWRRGKWGLKEDREWSRDGA